MNEGGNYQLLIEALIPMDKPFIKRVDLYLQNKIDEILPHSTSEEKEDLLVVPDIVLSVQEVSIREKATGMKMSITDLFDLQ